jgi:hypothetical protein
VVRIKCLVPGLEGPLSTLLGHSASHSERLFLPHLRHSPTAARPSQVPARPAPRDLDCVPRAACNGADGGDFETLVRFGAFAIGIKGETP